jgi:hypothetical protein
MIHLTLSRSSKELCVAYGAEYGIKTGEDLTKEASFYNCIKSVQLSKRKSIFFSIFRK